ncbi:glycoside hydrolase family 35 protein [Microbacterium sp. 179-I 3D3 NHS]|uniref:glycoside hydrolase family 35 protein n=1 Tax=Microbacterium sp. 179-I 3D3 NHS TaxID=3142382 RepID=UPI0039A1C8D9
MTVPAPLLTVEGDALLRDGRPHRILAGSMHYFRVHPDLWQDRLRRLAAMGMNTVDTYVAWNFHRQLHSDPHDFGGARDIGRFVRLAQAEGLDVIVRPGPYICAEWDNGGFPAWVTAQTGPRVRSLEPAYLDVVAEWFDHLLPELVPLQAAFGGPIVAFQIENEYGSFGDDTGYLEWMREAMGERGVSELMYTADGPTHLMFDGGTLPGVLAAATFGTNPDHAVALLRERGRVEPFLCAEFWDGWFDHWGKGHNTRSVDSAAHTLRGILEHGSVSVYMAHGGTNFGLWSGANEDDGVLSPTVTSYDSDAPVGEDGRLTGKFHAFRELFGQYGGDISAALPPAPAVVAPQRIELTPGSDLLAAAASVSPAVRRAETRSFDELSLASGLMLYRSRPVLPPEETTLTITGLHDRALVFVDGVLLGVSTDETAVLPITGAGRAVDLEIVVENEGRINYGPMLGQGKGILGHVRVERRKVHGWEMHPLPLDRWGASELDLLVRPEAQGVPVVEDRSGRPRFSSGSFELPEAADAHLALPGAERGFVWINGFLLGRYRAEGPQETLYIPAPLLRADRNTVVVLDLAGTASVAELRDTPSLGAPVEFAGY